MGFKQLYLDFLRREPSALRFYPNQAAPSVMQGIDAVEFPREELAEILTRQSTAWGAKPATFKSIEKLKDPRSAVVFAGQQAGLFGGPLLGFYKALWAVKKAARLEQELQRPVAPIFWIAADDHDFEEINHTFVYDVLGEPAQVSYYRSEEAGRPAYQRLFSCSDVFREACEKLSADLGETDFTGELYQRLFSAYREGVDFVTAFGTFMADLFPDIGLVLFSPGDDAFKRLSVPFYRELLSKRKALKSLLSERNKELSAAGYHLQTHKEDSACHLFALTPERTAVHASDDDFRIGERRLSRAEFENLIECEPERLSPDVITRPVLAAYLFPTVAQGGGPSEVSYFAQLAPLYELFGRPAPMFAGRISATVIEKRFERFLKKHQMSVMDFSGDVERVVNQILAKSFPEDLEEKFTELRRLFNHAFNEVAKEAVAFDRTLEKNAAQMWGKIDHTLSTFEKKVFASHKRKLSDERAAIYRAANAFFPRGALQERSINIIYYISRYGYRFVDYLVERLELSEDKHQLVHISEMDGSG